ncbi:MAG: DUF444 family protein [Planctomycetota bacterium]|nr:DUF444 family protein [Planctomycetota bacterium]
MTVSQYRRIDRDHSRFRQIVRGKIKQNLKKYVKNGNLIGRQGQDLVSIPLPQIELPHFRYGPNPTGGLGQGQGQPGDPMDGQSESGNGNAGNTPGAHVLEVEVTLDDLADILGEHLGLPNIEPRGNKNILGQRHKYNSIRKTGPESLRHFRRTYRAALKRTLSSGLYDPNRPVIIPIRDDQFYESGRPVPDPETSAVVIYMMDVSGSMGAEQKEIVRIETFWIDTWLRRQYENIKVRYIVHDASAKEVDSHTFYHLSESGGTRISSAYDLCLRMIDQDHPPSEWNIYPFHFSDGDNWGGDDTRRCIDLLEHSILPRSNMFCYGQVKSSYGSGQFKNDIDDALGEQERLITSEIQNRDQILDSIETFLTPGF